MTVSAAPALAGPFDGNDAATSFPFDFKIFAESDLRVVLRDAPTAEYLLTLDVDYSVSMNPDQNADPGGTITYPLSGSPLATGERLTVTTDLELSQQTVFTNLGKFFPATVEDTFDRLTMLLRQIQAESVRAIRVPVSLSDVLTDLPTPVPGAGLVWNEDGTALVNGVLTESLIAISSFMSNVIQAVDAAEARSDIGAAADGEVVKLTGAQTIADVKTFSSSPIIPNGAAAQNPASKAQLDAEAAARAAAIAAAVVPATLAPSLRVVIARQALTGTAVTVGPFPSWVNDIIVHVSGASTDGTGIPMLQLGAGATPTWITTGYAGGTMSVSSGAAVGVTNPTDGVRMATSFTAGRAVHGPLRLSRLDYDSGTDTDTWMVSGVCNDSSGAVANNVAYTVSFTGRLTNVRVTTTAGNLDAGAVSAVGRA